MIRKIKNLLKNFDYFAVKINFNYKEKTRFQTATGGLIFLIVMLSLFIQKIKKRRKVQFIRCLICI